MFGVLRGAGCGLPQNQREQWMNHICGVCLALRDHGGQVARLCTNYDAALISVLCEAQTADYLPTQTSVCPLRGRRRLTAAVIAPTSAAAQYAATLALAAGATKMADHVADNDGWWGAKGLRPWVNWLSGRWHTLGQQMGQALGFDTQAIRQQVGQQPAREAAVGQDFLFYAAPTELAVGAAFAHTALLSGRPHNAQLLQELGRQFGRIMYLLDSYADYAADQQSGHFNALAASYPQADQPTLTAEARALFHTSYRALKKAFFQLDLPQPELSRQLLVHQLKRRGVHLLGGAAVGCAICTPNTHEQLLDEEAADDMLSPAPSQKKRRRDYCDFCCCDCHCESGAKEGDGCTCCGGSDGGDGCCSSGDGCCSCGDGCCSCCCCDGCDCCG